MSDRENSTGEKADNTLHDRIKLRAYELYQSRGSVDGSDLQDWLKLSGRYFRASNKTHRKTADFIDLDSNTSRPFRPTLILAVVR
jgi:DUF2934 family protein